MISTADLTITRLQDIPKVAKQPLPQETQNSLSLSSPLPPATWIKGGLGSRSSRAFSLQSLSKQLQVLIGQFLISSEDTPYFAKNNRSLLLTCRNLRACEGDILKGSNAAVRSILRRVQGRVDLIRQPLQRYVRKAGHTISSLELYHRNLTPEQVQDFLVCFPNLKVLSVSQNNTSDQHLCHIAQLTALQAVSFSESGTIGHTIDQLQTVTTLREVSICKTAISAENLVSISKMSGLVKLRLVECGLSSEFLEAQVHDLLSPLENLQELSLSHVPINRNFFSAIAHLSQLRTLSLFHYAKDRQEDFEFISPFLDLQELNLHKVQITPKILAFIASMTGLVRLKISSYIPDAAFEHIVHLPLQELHLDDTQITDKCLASIAKIKTLRVLSLARNPRLKHIGMMLHLHKLVNLSELNLSGNWMHPSGFMNFAKLQKLQKLNLSEFDFDRHGPDILKYLSSVANLTELNLSSAHFSASTHLGSDSMHLRKFKNLTVLSLSDTTVSDIDLYSLACLKNLRRLNLTKCSNITDKGRDFLNEQLPKVYIQE